MANYYATARSNYFGVKDEAAFKAWAASRQLTLWDKPTKDSGMLYAISPSDYDDSGSWPTSLYDEASDDYLDVDITDELVAHLADGHVAVLMEAGAEKLRYISAYAVAVHSSGEVVRLSLNDIYRMAQEAFGADAIITDASY